jgi:hypothetical protein
VRIGIIPFQVFALRQAGTELPNIPPPAGEAKATDIFKEPNPIQQSLVSAYDGHPINVVN